MSKPQRLCFLLYPQDHTRKSDQCYSCVIQYVLFPPYHRPSEAERSDEAVVDWAYEVKPPSAQSGRTFNMVTEVWAEPQFGRLTDLSPELRYLESLMYNQVPNGVSVGELVFSTHAHSIKYCCFCQESLAHSIRMVLHSFSFFVCFLFLKRQMELVSGRGGRTI